MKFGKIRPQSSVSGTWELVEETTIGTATASYTFSSLTGNTAEVYLILANITNDDSTAASYFVRPNNDSTSSNYGQQEIYGSNTTISAIRNTSNSGIIFNTTGIAQNNYGTYFLLIYAKSGYIRTALVEGEDNITGTTVNTVRASGTSWTDTSNQITSLVIGSNQTNGLGVGTYLALYKKVA